MILDTITYENTHTVQELMEKSVEAYRQRDILRYEVQDVIQRITYGEFQTLCRKIGQFLDAERNALGRQVHVGIVGHGSANYVIALMGVMASGNVAVPMDHQLNEIGLADCMNRSDVDILLYDGASMTPVVQKAKALCPNVRSCYSMQPMEGSANLDDILNDARYDGETWRLNGDYQAPGADDLAMILFTSGTSGKSKGVMLTHQNLVGNALSQSPIENDEFDEIVSLLVLPMHHVFCVNVDVIAMLYRGGTTCINGEIQLLGKHLRMFQPTVLHVVPMITKVLYNKIKAIVSEHPGLTETDAMRIVYGRRLGRIICGGGGLPEELARKYQQMGIRIGQGYGMSECAPVISEPDYEKPEKVSSAGKLLEHIKIRVADNGEIQIQSPFVMKGYYGDPERTKEAFTEDGWLKTGDVGYVDEENFIYLTGRLKNLIILSNGENVSPEEIEAKFSAEPLIRDILVFDEDDMIKCEVFPESAYAQAAGIADIAQAVEAIVNRHNLELPTYQRIVQVSIRNQPFVKTTSNKIIRQAFFDERKSLQKAQRERLTERNKPANNIQAIIFAQIRRFLPDNVGNIGLDDNLFNYGLDSLTVLEISTYLECSPTIIYECKTVRKIAERLGEETQADVSRISKEMDINREIQNAKRVPFDDSGAILITGATGYLGPHIIMELCKQRKPVICLIRSKERFDSACQYYGVKMTDQIAAVPGDVTKPQFGLTDEAYAQLGKKVSAVFHAAASVSHAGDTANSYAINVGGTEEVIRFCEVSGAQLYHMSSFAVSGFETDTPLTEDALDIGQQITQNPYIQTKYQAEEKVLRARSQGVNSTIFRIGNLTKRASDGLFQMNADESGLSAQLRALEKLGVYPESMNRMAYDDTPVDLAAEAIVALALNDGCGNIWHIMNPYVKAIAEVSDAKEIPDGDFNERLLKNIQDRDVSVFSMYYRMCRDGLNINFDARKTLKELGRLGFFWKK